jgi:hypothetical protein
VKVERRPDQRLLPDDLAGFPQPVRSESTSRPTLAHHRPCAASRGAGYLSLPPGPRPLACGRLLPEPSRRARWLCGGPARGPLNACHSTRLQRVASRHARAAPFLSTLTPPVWPCVRFIPLRVFEMAQTPSLQPLEGLADQFSVWEWVWHEGRHFIQEGQRLEGRLCGHDTPLSYLTA